MHSPQYGSEIDEPRLPSNASQESETQTSKTILQLAAIDIQNLNLGKYQSKLSEKSSREEKNLLKETPNRKSYNDIYLNRQEFLRSTSPMKHITADTDHKPVMSKGCEIDKDLFCMPHLSRFTIKKIKVKAVSAASMEKEIKEINLQASASQTPSPCCSPNPIHCQSPSLMDSRSPSPVYSRTQSPEQIVPSRNVSDLSDVSKSYRTASSDYEYNQKDEIIILLTRAKCSDWNISLAALKQLANISENCVIEVIYPFMPEINQRLIALLQSPRSHVCRTCCQIAGRLFKTVGDIRRPEFDDIVDLLLSKTADSNRFIKIDANNALDNLISNIPPYHAVRSLCNKGTRHKNDLVRVATSRLFYSIINLCGPNLILGSGGNEFTRKRIIGNMINFLNDKNVQVRRYGEELRKLLAQHANYKLYIKKSVDNKYVEI